MVNVQAKGIHETIRALEKNLGEVKTRAISKRAIDVGAEKVKKQLQTDLVVFKDKGYTIDEVVRKKATYKNYKAGAEIGWNGPHERYRLIHLNEWGYTRNGKQYRPRGFGVITKSLKQSEAMYFDTIYREVKKSL
ncbi:hypothetical protein [Enterococcus mundtii]|uniref:hypothetical protein n=1 Tax=Enterococcus mundtii TaxID=53346 RepID=UPI000A34B302|nr:hypothetical protein [Enterococcus mundtii]